MTPINEITKEGAPKYITKSGKLQVHKSIVAFVDILGFTNRILQNKDTASAAKLHNHLNQMHLSIADILTEGDLYHVFNFLDSIVLGWPIAKDQTKPLYKMCQILVESQLTMLMFDNPFFLRGGVALGDACFSNRVQGGEGYLAAYKIESERSIYPQIVLSDKLIPLVKQTFRTYSKEHDLENDLFLVDADGELFINYLSAVFPTFNSKNGENDIIDFLKAHRDAIELELGKSTTNLKIYRKYQWVARYHDYFCDRLYNWLNDDLCIKIDYGKERFSPPRQLSEVFS